MRRLRPILIGVIAVALVGAPVAADPGHIPGDRSYVVTDDPGGAYDPGAGFDGAGITSVEASLGNQPLSTATNKSRNVTLVGTYAGATLERGYFGDVAGYKDLAFLGKWRGACPGTGVDIIDISRPSNPTKLSDTLDHVDTSMEDMEAIKIGNRDILAVGLQDCGNDPTPGVGQRGLELYDISNPANPVFLSLFDTTPGGVHELDLTVTPDGRTLALLTSPDREAATSDANGVGGVGDLLIVDISNPATPVLAGEWGVLDAPEFGLAFYLSVRQGGDARTQLHGVRANDAGTKAYLSYWDAGTIILDITNPAVPVVEGRTVFPAGAEGNAHSVDIARDDTLLVQADEDFSPFEFRFTSSAFAGTRQAVEAAFTPPIVNLTGRAMEGVVVHVGRGCPAGSIAPGSPADTYLADPAGKIALIARGACGFSHKIDRAMNAGATGVIVYNSVAGGEGLVRMGASGSFPSPTIPAVFVQRSTGLLLIAGIAPVTARAAAVFNGWGYLRLFDISDPANPVALSTFATPNTNNEAVATTGDWSVHNPEIHGSTLYASWYSDGFRVIDISKPSNPQEIGSWTGAGSPSPLAVNIWTVVPHRGLLLASDRNYGLYILKANGTKP